MTNLIVIRAIVAKNASRIALLGRWPAGINAHQSLTSRIPIGQAPAPGFDAGIACTLDLIPRNKQKLAAILHAAYTPEAVTQIRREAVHLDADSQTCWWLAACSVCKEGIVTAADFKKQLTRFADLTANPDLRLREADRELSKMLRTTATDLHGFPFGIFDGCIPGAYLAGHAFGTMFSGPFCAYFIGTFHPSLGLEKFPWSDGKDDQGRPKSGPVFGSRQFVKAATEEEFLRAVKVVRAYLKE